MAEHHGSTVAVAALALLRRLRGPCGLGVPQCDRLEAMLETAADEGRILAKASKALWISCREAKEALLRCRASDGDEAARLERQRVIGMLEDVVRGLAETDALRVGWLASAVAEVMSQPPKGGGGPDGVLPFDRKKGS